MEKLNELAKKLNDMETNISKLMWVQYTVGYDFGIDKAYEELNGILENKENYNLVMDYKDKDLNEEDKRRVEIAYNAIKPYHLSEELNKLNLDIQKLTNELSIVLNTFRFKIHGKEVSSVDLTQILANEDDRDLRKEAYFARNQINQPLVDAGFIDLIHMRKEYAQLYGDKDFVEHSLKQNELSPSLFQSWRDEVKSRKVEINNKRKEYAQKYLNDDEIMPWDGQYIAGKIAPAQNTTVDMSNYYRTLRKFFLNFELDLDKFNITYDIFSRKNKSEWGYNFPIKDGVDSRILANVKNKYHEYGVLLHETGHGIHSSVMNPDEVILNRGVSGIIAEGIANLFGSFLFDEMFYKDFFKEDVKNQFKELEEFKKINSLRAVGDIFFDQDLYKEEINSIEDIYNLYFKNNEELFGDLPFNEAPPFGYRIHHTTHPIYLHNYFMGDVTCEMLRKVFYKKYNVESISEKPEEFGKFIIEEVINPTGMYKYEELFKRISGEEFSLKWILE